MGHVWVEAKIANPLMGQSIKVVALVDAGAAFTIVPSWIHEKPGLKVVGRRGSRRPRATPTSTRASR